MVVCILVTKTVSTLAFIVDTREWGSAIMSLEILGPNKTPFKQVSLWTSDFKSGGNIAWWLERRFFVFV